MKTRVVKFSLSAIGFALASSLPGCVTIEQVAKPALDRSLQEKVEKAAAVKELAPPSVAFRSGDTYTNAFRAMGMLDGTTYILDLDGSKVLPGASSPIFNAQDLATYFEAYGETLKLTPIANSKYIRVQVSKNDGSARIKASQNCKVTLAGTVPMGAVISDVAKRAGIEVTYADTGSAAYAGVMYPVGYRGTCAGALEYMGRKSDLSVTFAESAVTFRMMDTATVDIGIPLRDRRVAMDILADGSIAGGGGQAQGQGQRSGGSSSMGGSKSMQSAYMTNYLSSVKALLDSTKSPFGTWNYIPETGQIFIRDKADAVSATKANLNRLAQAFYGRFEVTLTLYRMTSNVDRQVSGTLARNINENLALSFGSASSALAKSALGINYDSTVNGGQSKSVVQLLSEFGNIETLDTFSLTLQSGIPQTLKVANNTEYVRNISSTTSGTTGGVTSSIEQANATDGSFVTVQARQAETGKIAIDFGAFINRLDGFDVTQTLSSTVKSQRGFERTFDTLALVDDGIPYIASIVSQKTRNEKTSTIPGLETATGGLSWAIPALAGAKSNLAAQTYIVVVVEARRQ